MKLAEALKEYNRFEYEQKGVLNQEALDTIIAAAQRADSIDYYAGRHDIGGAITRVEEWNAGRFEYGVIADLEKDIKVLLGAAEVARSGHVVERVPGDTPHQGANLQAEYDSLKAIFEESQRKLKEYEVRLKRQDEIIRGKEQRIRELIEIKSQPQRDWSLPERQEYETLRHWTERCIGEAVGAASTCWDSVVNAGVFHDHTARQIVEALMLLIDDGFKDSEPDYEGDSYVELPQGEPVLKLSDLIRAFDIARGNR